MKFGIHTARSITQLTTNFHLCRKRNHRNANLILDTGFEGFVDVARIACGQRPEDDDNFA